MKYEIECIWPSYGDGWVYCLTLIIGRSKYQGKTHYKTYAGAQRAARRVSHD